MMPCLHCQLATGKAKTHIWCTDQEKRFVIVDDPQTGSPLAVMCDHRAKKSRKTELEVSDICNVAFGEGKIVVKRRSGHLAYVWMRER